MEVLFQGEITDWYAHKTRRTISWGEPFYGGIPLSNIGIDPGRARKVICSQKEQYFAAMRHNERKARGSKGKFGNKGNRERDHSKRTVGGQFIILATILGSKGGCRGGIRGWFRE